MARVPKKFRVFFEASVRSYYTLTADRRERTSLASWVALKLGVSARRAQNWIDSEDLDAITAPAEEKTND